MGIEDRDYYRNPEINPSFIKYEKPSFIEWYRNIYPYQKMMHRGDEPTWQCPFCKEQSLRYDNDKHSFICFTCCKMLTYDKASQQGVKLI